MKSTYLSKKPTTIKAEYLSFGGDKMSNFFALLLVISFFALPYYGIKRYMTKKKNPEVYAKIKKRIWYALIIFVISFIGVGAPQPAAAKTKAPQHDKVSTVDNKLTAAKSAVNALFTNSKHTKLKQDVTKHDITAC
ncbi:toxin Cry1Ac domain D-VI-related protein [Latilactobacillus sakei]